MVSVKVLKKLLKKSNLIVGLVSKARQLNKRLGFARYPRMRNGEIEFFSSIAEEINVLVDVGARFDTDYIQLSTGRNIRYYLFEANPSHFKRLMKNLRGYSDSIYAFNLAVGERCGLVDYFEDSESVLIDTTAVKNSKARLNAPIKMVRLDSHLGNIGVKQIDFLKTDIEEYDYFALIGAGHLIQSCKYIQFELGIGAPLHDRFVTNEDYYSLLGVDFDLYILKDEFCPIWSDGLVTETLIRLDETSKAVISELQKDGIGFNIVGVKKGVNLPSNIKIAALDGGKQPAQ